MKTYRIFLDDIRTPFDAFLYTKFEPYINQYWTIVRNYDEFVKCIIENYSNGQFPEIIGFDHDLSDQHYSPMMVNADEYNELSKSFTEKTGMDCAKWLIDFCIDNNLKLPNFYVHSMNPVGRENIQSILENYKKHEEK